MGGNISNFHPDLEVMMCQCANVPHIAQATYRSGHHSNYPVAEVSAVRGRTDVDIPQTSEARVLTSCNTYEP